jgi:hypothetical protein
MHQIIAYGLTSTKELKAEEKAAEQWTHDHGIEGPYGFAVTGSTRTISGKNTTPGVTFCPSR